MAVCVDDCTLSVVLVALLSVFFCIGGAQQETNVSLPLSPQATAMQLYLSGNDSCPTPQQIEMVRKYTSGIIRSQLEQLTHTVIPCSLGNIGRVAHCPATNCSEIFKLVETGLFLFSSFYWLQFPNENATRVYCNRETGYPEVSSCELLFRYHPPTLSGSYTLLLADGVRSIVYCNRETGQAEPESCAHAHQLELPSGTYTIRPPGHSPISNVICDMDREVCGSRWWTQVASYNFTDPSTSCPGDWQLVTSPVRACSRVTTNECDSVSFSTHRHEYTRVCGRVIAYQRGPAYGFWLGSHTNTLDSNYIDGVSITHGDVPRQHIWSFAASLGDSYCPCNDLDAPHPNFVRNSYFCETDSGSGVQPGVVRQDNPLWDGVDCPVEDTCCSFNNPPWFSTALPNATSDDVEVRLCGVQTAANYSTPIATLDLYVQ